MVIVYCPKCGMPVSVDQWRDAKCLCGNVRYKDGVWSKKGVIKC